MKTIRQLQILALLMLISASTFAQLPEKVGLWKFDESINLTQASIGEPLLVAGEIQSVSGPKDGNGAAAIGVGSYLVMDHGILGNGGGSQVNDYSIQIDFSVPEIGIWHSFYQTDELNESDGDLFTSASTNAIGTSQTKYSTRGISADTWYRMVLTVRNNDHFRVYMNGELWLDSDGWAIDGRFSLASTLLMFADDDGEDGIIYCSELGIWDTALEEYEVQQLGDASGDRSRSRERMGWWKFDDTDNLLRGEEGYPLELIGSQESVPGPSEGNLAVSIGVGSYLKMTNNFELNGEESLVNEYSLQVDFSVPEEGVWHAFFQTNPTNGDDADLFAEDSEYRVGNDQTGYTTNAIESDRWYRMVISVKNGEFFRIYLNGEKWLDAPGQSMDGRFALDDMLLIFADDDGQDGEIICSELSIWEVALTDEEVSQIGNNPAGSIPGRSGWWKFDDPGDLLKADIGNKLMVEGFELEAPGPDDDNGAVMIGLGYYLSMDHGITGNGNGNFVNEYTLQIDFSITETGIWYAFYQTTEDNSDDADLFIASSDYTIGTATTGYSTNAISANYWYRMIISVKNGSFFKVYINGDLWLESAGQPVDGRFSLANTLLLFADNDGDDGTILCSEMGIWDVALNADQIEKLGDATTSIATNMLTKHRKPTSGLEQNYPNPFSDKTILPYHIGEAGDITVRIFDISGREVLQIREGAKEAGSYELMINSDQFSDGLYYVRMQVDERTYSKKMIIVK